ncbi:MAG: DNA polymerase I [Planctomycetes bacterium]|nr:DNA polymerase I [Planctomycetota bacterium]
MPKSLHLIDGHAQVYRAFYAIEGLHAPDGRPTGAVSGFTSMLIDIIKKHAPEYLAVVFDAPGPTFRHEMYKEYKATRKPTPQELLSQIPIIEEVVKGFNIPIYKLAGYEADDLIGTFARQAVAEGLDVVLVSSDKDLGQLLSPGIRLYDPRKDIYTSAKEYEEKKKIPPALLPDVMGLSGDSSDNIPGVPGIGEKGAVELINKYGSLEGLLAHAHEIKGKRGEKLRENLETARLSRELATINCEVPIKINIEDCRQTAPNEVKLREIYEDLGFERLKRTLGAVKAEKLAEADSCDYRLVNTPALFKTFIKELQAQKHFAFDVETTSVDPMQAELVGMSFSWEGKTGWYLPFRAPEGEKVLTDKELQTIGKLLTDPKHTKTGHNLKYDTLVMRRIGINLDGIVFDSMLASHLCAGHLRGHGLDATAARILHVGTIHIDEIIGKGKKQITIDLAPLEQVCRYAAEDADIALRLQEALWPQLIKEGYEELFNQIELPLSKVLTDMQQLGVRLDISRLGAMSKEMEKQLARLTEEILYLAGDKENKLNIASPKQLAELLFEKLKFPVIRKTKTGYSTDEQVLRELTLVDHPKRALPKLILEYRMYSKLKSTYLDALPEMVNPNTGRIHTTFHQTGTATGRLSSSDPNLQNIPVRTEEGRSIRAAFIPEEGWQMLAADYSQIELRILAHFSGDDALCKAFQEDRDIHAAVAAAVFGVDLDKILPEQRYAAKAINFGIIYGQTAFGLSQTTDMNRFEAKNFIESYFKEFPKVKVFMDEALAQANESMKVSTIKGRRREIPELASSNHIRRQHGERMAINTIIQGSAADLIKIAMIKIHDKLAEEKLAARMVLQIHDELVFECPPEETEKLASLVRTEMENAMELSIPLKVDIGTGANWLEVK